jgi:hypothetical protein
VIELMDHDEVFAYDDEMLWEAQLAVKNASAGL